MIDLSKLQVVPYPHPALRWMAKPVPKVTPIIQDVARRMIEVMHEYRGIGLSANQVALPWRIFVTCVNEKELIFINPEIHLGRNKRDTSPRIVLENEACLSFPGLNIEEPIPRAKDIYVEALDVNGKPFTISGPGLLARVILHEADHLNGILFIDYLKLEGMINLGHTEIPMKDYFNQWLKYLETQYEYMSPTRCKSGNPTYGTDDEEKQKLLKLEVYLNEFTS